MDCKFISISDVTNERGVRMDNKDNYFFNYFNELLQNANIETKQQVTQMYIEGRINKEDYMRRMKNAK